MQILEYNCCKIYKFHTLGSNIATYFWVALDRKINDAHKDVMYAIVKSQVILIMFIKLFW